jgi:hypothetical protein
MLVSDPQARQKPCLRCGYSLRHIVGARNCPECGLAVRISLSGNSGLEWSNPVWQRFLAVGFGVLAVGMLCKAVSACAWWLVRGAMDEIYQMGYATFMALHSISSYASDASPIVCGVGLCLLAKGERRYPDKSRSMRAIVLGAGIVLTVLGLIDASIHHGFWRSRLTSYVWYVCYYSLHRPWLAPVLSILTCTYAFDLARRSGSRLLRRLSQAPLWPAAAGVVVWVMNLDRLWWPLDLLLADVVFPVCMMLMLVVTIRVLLAGAREAEANWVTDP